MCVFNTQLLGSPVGSIKSQDGVFFIFYFFVSNFLIERVRLHLESRGSISVITVNLSDVWCVKLKAANFTF